MTNPLHINKEGDRERLARKVIDMGDDPGVLACGGESTGTTHCPICGWDWPHEHTPDEIVRYRNAQKSQRAHIEDWDAFKAWADELFPAHRPAPTGLWEAWLAARDHYRP